MAEFSSLPMALRGSRTRALVRHRIAEYPTDEVDAATAQGVQRHRTDRALRRPRACERPRVAGAHRDLLIRTEAIEGSTRLTPVLKREEESLTGKPKSPSASEPSPPRVFRCESLQLNGQRRWRIRQLGTATIFHTTSGIEGMVLEEGAECVVVNTPGFL